MRTWDPDGPAAPVAGVPPGCRAVPLVELVDRDGTPTEVRDRRRRRKTTTVVLVADPEHPPAAPNARALAFARGAGRRRWPTVTRRFGDRALAVSLDLVRAGAVHLACTVDDRGRIGVPLWWQQTPRTAETVRAERAREAARAGDELAARDVLVAESRDAFPDVAGALERAASPAAVAVVSAAARDLLAGLEHSGPRAFAQAHFGSTKAHDVTAVLDSVGFPPEALVRLGLRRGDRVGLGGPVVVETAGGAVDLASLRGPVLLRLDQPDLRVRTAADHLVVIENLQPAEAVCVRNPELAVVYTAGQFGSDTAAVLAQLATGRRTTVIVDADLGGVRIARRSLEAVPAAEVVDVGTWPHPPRGPFTVTARRALGTMTGDPFVGWFAAAVLARGYPVEQELATFDILDRIAGAR